MILKKVINLCKNREHIALFNAGDRQWISDGFAVYPLEGVPFFDAESLMAVFDIKGKKKEKMAKYHFSELPEQYCFDDVCEEETLCEIHPVKICIDSVTYTQVLTSKGCEFVSNKYLEPLKDTNEDMMGIYERFTADGNSYFVVKDGLLLIALILPVKVLNEKTMSDLKMFVNRCEVRMKNEEGQNGE